MLKIKCFGTGSRGNSYQIITKKHNFIIDAGIVLNLLELKTDMSKVEQIFISHEHLDHIAHLSSILRNYPKIKLVTSPGTFEAWKAPTIQKKLVNFNAAFEDGEFWKMLKVSHDAKEPVGFIFDLDTFYIGYLTDLGCITDNLKEEYKKLDKPLYLLIEANYDELDIFNIDFHRVRVMGDKGHLSNEQCYNFIKEVKPHWYGILHKSAKNSIYLPGDTLYNGWEKHWK